MFDRAYFESVLSDQLRLMGRSCRLIVGFQTGTEYDVASLVAAHLLILGKYLPGPLSRAA